MKLSVIVPAYNEEKIIDKILSSLKKQTVKDFELIVVDDCSSDNTFKIAKKYAKVVKTNKNSGPAIATNLGIKKASGEIIAFTDADCIAAEDWVENILKESSKNPDAGVIAGDTKIPKSNFIGDSISAMGFPGGGSIGFDKMWKVTKKGYTDHVTSCNMAVRRSVFNKIGLLDEDFPVPGGEDAEFSVRLNKKGAKIKYCPNVVIYHEPRNNFSSFLKWQITRGEGNYYFHKKVGGVGSFIMLRLWSTKNIIKKFIFKKEIFLIVPLLFLSFILQQFGYIKTYAKNINFYLISKFYKKPLSLQIEPTTRCNLNCEMCEHSYSKNKSPIDLSLERFNRIKGGYIVLNLTGVGESLMNKNFLGMIKRLKRRTLYLTFADNFTLLNKDIIKKLIQLKVNSVFISLDGATKKIFELIRRGANFDRVISNIKEFVKIKEEMKVSKPKLIIRFVPSLKNIKELPEIVKLAYKLKIKEIHFPKLYTFEETEKLKVDKNTFEKYRKKANEIAKRLKIKLKFESKKKPLNKCRALYSMYICANGEVLPCCFILQKGDYNSIIKKYSLGDISKNSIKYIWNSKRYKVFREMLNSNLTPEMCKNCELYGR